MFDDSYRIRIPNKEVKSEFKRIVANYTKIGENLLGKMFRALMSKDMENFITVYKKIIKNCSSYFDASDKENSYHMLMLGMSIYLEPYFRVESNREEGDVLIIGIAHTLKKVEVVYEKIYV